MVSNNFHVHLLGGLGPHLALGNLHQRQRRVILHLLHVINFKFLIVSILCRFLRIIIVLLSEMVLGSDLAIFLNR